MNISIKLDGRKNSKTKKGFPIIFYVTKNSKKKLIRTGYYSEKKNWNKSNALPNSKHPDYVELINFLEQKKIAIAKVLEQHRLEPMPMQRAINLIIKKSNETFYREAKEHITNRTSKNALESFNGYYPDYTFNQIDKSIAKEYINKLSVTPIPNGNKRSPNGINSYMNSLTALWNKCEKPNNPFSRVRLKERRTKNKALTLEDLIKVRDNNYIKHKNSKGGGVKNYLNYFMLCFYLGGVDMGDLAQMKYENIVNNRIEFHRHKGGTEVFVSNYIFPEAWEIINQYDCKPYLIPIRKLNNYNNFIANMSRYFQGIKEKLNISKKPYSKAPRYTFITRAQHLLIDERLVIEIVGHSQSSTHSIYKDEFPYHVRDEAHKRIIDLKQ